MQAACKYTNEIKDSHFDSIYKFSYMIPIYKFSSVWSFIISLSYYSCYNFTVIFQGSYNFTVESPMQLISTEVRSKFELTAPSIHNKYDTANAISQWEMVTLLGIMRWVKNVFYAKFYVHY